MHVLHNNLPTAIFSTAKDCADNITAFNNNKPVNRVA